MVLNTADPKEKEKLFPRRERLSADSYAFSTGDFNNYGIWIAAPRSLAPIRRKSRVVVELPVDRHFRQL